MRRLTMVCVLALVAGCADNSKKPDDGTPPPRTTAQPKPQPKPQPAQPADPPASDDAIVIKGSKKTDSSTSAPVSDAERQRKIDELAAKAKASEGKDNGPAYRENADAKPTDASGKKDLIRQQMADCDAQITKLLDEKTAMTTKVSGGRGAPPREVFADPERAKQIDIDIDGLKKKKDLLQRKLVELDLADAPK